MNIRIIDRNPLTVRKMLVGRRAALLRLDAGRSIARTRFNLGGNSFSVFRPSLAGRKLAVSLASHLAGIFRGKFIGIWFEKQLQDRLSVHVRVSDLAIHYTQTRHSISKQESRYLVFQLDFDIEGNDLALQWIRSQTRRQNRGGNALAMLHNIAEEIGSKTICFHVDMYNDEAKAFYRHMNFGQPQDPDSTSWIMKLSV